MCTRRVTFTRAFRIYHFCSISRTGVVGRNRNVFILRFVPASFWNYNYIHNLLNLLRSDDGCVYYVIKPLFRFKPHRSGNASNFERFDLRDSCMSYVRAVVSSFVKNAVRTKMSRGTADTKTVFRNVAVDRFQTRNRSTRIKIRY